MMQLFFVLLNVITVFSSNQEVWYEHENYKYFVSRESVNHSDATLRCNHRNAHLVDVFNHNIQEFLENIIKKLPESKSIFHYSTIIYFININQQRNKEDLRRKVLLIRIS